VDDPTYPGAIAAFLQAGAQLVPMAVDDGGVRPEEVARALARRPALVYIQSGPHSPTGQVLSDQRRRVIADLVTAARVPLVEDAALADLAWRPPPPPVAAWCGDAAVAVIGSFSKLYWGGLRVGFVRAPEPVALRFVRVKATHDLGSSAVSQLMTEQLLQAPLDGTDGVGGFPAWRRRDLQDRYAVLATALRRHLPDWEWAPPAGGMSLWVRLPSSDAGAFAQAALRNGVAVATATPLSSPSSSGGHRDHLRLSFSPAPDALEEGVHRLAGTWADRWR
jgi:DNA-binding transcriptional MocR family regulator